MPDTPETRTVADVVRAVTRARGSVTLIKPLHGGQPSRLHPPLVPPQHHTYYEVAICFAGTMILAAEEKLHELRAGDAVVVMPGAWHYETYRKASESYELFWLIPETEHVNCVFTCYRKGSFTTRRQSGAPAIGEKPLVETLARELTAQPIHWRERSRALLTEILIDYDRRLQGAPPSRPPDMDPVQKLARILETRFREPLQVKSLSREVGLSADHLSRRFKEVFGMAFKDYLNTIRIHHAQLLLKSGWSIKKTAGECGFSDVYYFGRVFKERCKTTPGKFMKEVRG